MSARQLLLQASKNLIEVYGSKIILANEIGLSNGACIMDLVGILDDYIIGVEIKGPGDTLNRVIRQMRYYQGVCREVNVVLDKKHQQKAYKELLTFGGGVRIIDHTYMEYGNKFDKPLNFNECNIWQCPSLIASCLWKNELVRVLRESEALPKGWSKMTKEELLTHTRYAPIAIWEKIFVETLKLRVDIQMKDMLLRQEVSKMKSSVIV